MAVTNELKEWWTKALLNQQTSAHPVFGNDIHVKFDGDVATLTGEVETVERAQEVERELRSIRKLGTVVNHLKIADTDEQYHLQTVIAIFPDRDAAQLASQSVEAQKFHEAREPIILETEEEACRCLQERIQAAAVPEDGVGPYVDAVRGGKVLLVDHVPEDDALQVVSTLEGTRAESIRTLPPEPDAVE